MNPDALNDELRKPVNRIPRLPFGKRGMNWLARSIFDLAASTKPLKDSVTVENHKVSGRTHRVITPKDGSTNGGAALWFYAGGYLAGRPSHLDYLGSLIASRLGVAFVAPEYRLAPRHPFPAAIYDADESWRWVTSDQHGLNIAPERVAVGGNSAGGGLAAGLAQHVQNLGRDTSPCAQALLYPMLDDRTATDYGLDEKNHFIWNNKQNRFAWSAYLGSKEPGSAGVPATAAPARRTDLAGLPPAWVGVCELDLFATEGRSYGERLTAAGVECAIHCVEGAPHAFETIAPDATVSSQFVDSAVDFLSQHIGADPQSKRLPGPA